MTLRHHFELRETIATILADDQSVIDAACEGIRSARHEIERYILFDPFFEMSYEPVVVKEGPDIIQKMADAAEIAGVGPMAAVAGAVACAGVRAAHNTGASFCIIDNGGDIAMITDRPVHVGLYAGRSPLSGRYAFCIPPKEDMYGICTSSATVGHSFSFGTADSVTVFSPDPILADATATAICNALTITDQSCLEQINPIIEGIFAVFGEQSIIWGDIPTIVRAESREELITAGGLGFISGSLI
ncbi:MAG TPA: UPF0280 family protein [Methanospirillum sp.]|uniref:UPF0280 family protein n=2 Tax=Methanospirillum sp. TaxID=45200 RepID=UPI002BB74B7A|nr:UPF0280 family protein [Methanospirillum sp.]HOJ96189.1 UPF0280 family protein [Methanospirillum sp.]